MNTFVVNNARGKPQTELYLIGVCYQIIFICINLILMLNFVIAIMSSTYARYEGMKIGLYFNVLNQMFPSMEWDDCYGALIAVKPPLPTYILLLPAWPIYYMMSGGNVNKEYIKSFNNFLSYILYTPIAIIILIGFTVINIVLIPISYGYNIIRLFNKTMTCRSSNQWLRSVATFLLFILFGHVVLVLSIPFNSLQLLINLYASDNFHKDEDYKKRGLVSQEVLNIYIKSLTELKV